jgi:ER lumen protein retaining receptor
MVQNGFRLAADWIHALAVLIPIANIVRTRSCHAVSGKTAILYAVVFSCRYLDLLSLFGDKTDYLTAYNITLKIYFLLTSYLTIGFVYGLFRKTRDQSNDTHPVYYPVILATLIVLCTYTFDGQLIDGQELVWRFSIVLEIFAIVPQLHLTNNRKTIDKTIACYLPMLGSYRALYICNWLYRYQTEQYWESISFISGCVQTMIYLHFFARIYPRLSANEQREPIKIAQDVVYADDIKTDLSGKGKHDVPLIHNVV